MAAVPTPAVTPAPPVARAPIDITLPSAVTLPTSLINSVLSQIPSDLGTYQLPSSVPVITIHYGTSESLSTLASSSSTPLSSSETSTASSSTSPSSTAKSSKSSNTSLLAGVFVTVGLLILILLILLIWFLRRRRRRRQLDRDMAEAGIVPRGTVSRSRLHHIRGGGLGDDEDGAFTRTRSLLSAQSSFMRQANTGAAAVTVPQSPPEDYAGVGAYLGRRRRSSIERLGRPAMRSPLSPQGASYQSPTYSQIMSPRPGGLATQESGYTPYVAPVHHDGYFPPVFDAPDSRYAALALGGAAVGAGAMGGGARNPFADGRTPSTESSDLSSELPNTSPDAHRNTTAAAAGGAYEDPHYPFPQTPVAYYPDAATPAPADARSAYLTPHADSDESSAMVFAPTDGYRPARRSGSATNYGDWFTGGGRTFPAGAAPPAIQHTASSPGGDGTGSSDYWTGSSSSGDHAPPAASTGLGQGTVPFPSSSSGALATIPEGSAAARPPPVANIPVTPAEVSDESDYKAAKGLRVANE